MKEIEQGYWLSRAELVQIKLIILDKRGKRTEREQKVFDWIDKFI